MKFVKLTILMIAIGFGSNSFADCSVNLKYEKLIDCIVDRGASDKYYEDAKEKSSKRKQAKLKKSKKVADNRGK